MKLINVIVLVAFAGIVASAVQAAAQPNIVLIFIDDMGYGDIGPFGNTVNQNAQPGSHGARRTEAHSVLCL